MEIIEQKYGHKKMIVWQSIDQCDIIVREILNCIPYHEYKTRKQIDTASDSVGSNFVEGYYSGSLKEYLRFLRYAKRSLAEVQERVRRVFRKNYIRELLYGKFDERSAKTMYLLSRLIKSLENKLSGQPGSPTQ